MLAKRADRDHLNPHGPLSAGGEPPQAAAPDFTVNALQSFRRRALKLHMLPFGVVKMNFLGALAHWDTVRVSGAAGTQIPSEQGVHRNDVCQSHLSYV